jgi:hypothetical protein
MACGHFFYHPADALICIGLRQAEGHHPIGQQAHSPALAACRGGTTGFGHQTSFGLLIQLRREARAWTFVQRPQALLDEALAEAFARRAPHGERGGNGAVLPALSRFEQEAGAGHFAGRVRPMVQELCELLAFSVIKRDKILLLGHCWSASCREVAQTLADPRSSIKFAMMEY